MFSPAVLSPTEPRLSNSWIVWDLRVSGQCLWVLFASGMWRSIFMVLFNDAVIIPKYVMSNGKGNYVMMNCRQLGSKRSSPDWGKILIFCWRVRGKPQTISVYPLSQIRFQRGSSRVQVQVAIPGCSKTLHGFVDRYQLLVRRSFFIFKTEVSDWYFGGIRCSSRKGGFASFWEAAKFYTKCGGIWLRRAKLRDEGPVFVVYDALSRDDRFLTFRDNVMVSAARVKLSKKILDTSTLEVKIITFSPKRRESIV
jgi:hypothetical protein